MARPLAVALAALSVVAAWALLKAQAIPAWKDLPRDEPSLIGRLLEDTEYSETFTESKFSRIRPGMTKESVLSLVGQPLQILKKSRGQIVSFSEYRNGVSHEEAHASGDPPIDSEIYYYSRQAHPTADWYVRAVTFLSEGIVRSVERTFYVD